MISESVIRAAVVSAAVKKILVLQVPRFLKRNKEATVLDILCKIEALRYYSTTTQFIQDSAGSINC